MIFQIRFEETLEKLEILKFKFLNNKYQIKSRKNLKLKYFMLMLSIDSFYLTDNF
jgi:hypothetical protein